MAAPVGYIAAFGGGVISFVSPCVLPLVPGYLSVVTGLDYFATPDEAAPSPGRRSRTVQVCRETGLFILGFGAVFVSLGLAATSVGSALRSHQILLTRISGGVVLAMAVFLLGSLVGRAPWMYREARFHPDLSRFGPFAAPIAGVAFGFGWTPCLGPILASILAFAATTRGTTAAAGLLAAYTVGLGAPFLVVGLAFTRLTGAIRWIRKRSTAIVLVSVTLLGLFGVLLVLNRLTWVISELETVMRAIGLGRLVTAG